jgi:hypothetical protein
MYKEFFFSIIFLLTIYILCCYDSRIVVDNFKIRQGSSDIVKKKVEFLKELNDKAHTIVLKMYESEYPDKKISDRLYNRFKNTIINETPENDSSAAYTINKGPINICIEKKDGSFYNINDAFFVILHELAHVMSISYGHGEEFQENFNYIVKFAVKENLWKDKKYEENSTDYCGVKITSSPCDNNECSKKNLDYFFKESLLDN